jgi:hypothetical protein
MAKGDFEEAKVQLSSAVRIVEEGEFPLAAWRVLMTAARVHHCVGEADKADEFLHRSETVIQMLAANFDEDDLLRSSLLAGYGVYKQNIDF